MKFKAEKMFFSFVSELGVEVDVTHKIHWLTNKITESDELLWRIFIALDGNSEGMLTKGVRQLTPDGYLIDYNCIIEFDELQHFTEYRFQTLQYYPEEIRVGFDLDKYKSWCIQNAAAALRKGAVGYRKPKSEFPFENGRAAQRALFDACRDLLPHRYGLNPTVRISEFEVPSLFDLRKSTTSDNRRRAKEEVRLALDRQL